VNAGSPGMSPQTEMGLPGRVELSTSALYVARGATSRLNGAHKAPVRRRQRAGPALRRRSGRIRSCVAHEGRAAGAGVTNGYHR
jgi:hypothetical protein